MSSARAKPLRRPMSQPNDLIAAARTARDRAYAPYSHFSVGAAIDATDGRRFTGANIENASYGLSMCAERVALFAAVHAGVSQIRAMAVAGPDGVTTAPCGACRQVLAEFGQPDVVVAYTADEGVVETTLGALLPAAFAADVLARASGAGR